MCLVSPQGPWRRESQAQIMLESRPSRPLGAEVPGRASWCPGADHSQGVLAVGGLLCDPLASLLSSQLEASPSSSRDGQGGLA